MGNFNKKEDNIMTGLWKIYHPTTINLIQTIKIWGQKTYYGTFHRYGDTMIIAYKSSTWGFMGGIFQYNNVIYTLTCYISSNLRQDYHKNFGYKIREVNKKRRQRNIYELS